MAETYIKILQADGTSIGSLGKHKYPLPVNGKPGEWTDVPGNGAYLCRWVNSHLFFNGPLLVEVEAKTPSNPICLTYLYGVECHSPVRVLRVLDWTDLRGSWHAYWAICECNYLTPEQVDILASKVVDSNHARWVLRERGHCLTSEQVGRLLSLIKTRDEALSLCECNYFTSEQQKTLHTICGGCPSRTELNSFQPRNTYDLTLHCLPPYPELRMYEVKT